MVYPLMKRYVMGRTRQAHERGGHYRQRKVSLYGCWKVTLRNGE
jgi:hypothetical protein